MSDLAIVDRIVDAIRSVELDNGDVDVVLEDWLPDGTPWMLEENLRRIARAAVSVFGPVE